jgi:hypothetical protein
MTAIIVLAAIAYALLYLGAGPRHLRRAALARAAADPTAPAL